MDDQSYVIGDVTKVPQEYRKFGTFRPPDVQLGTRAGGRRQRFGRSEAADKSEDRGERSAPPGRPFQTAVHVLEAPRRAAVPEVRRRTTRSGTASLGFSGKRRVLGQVILADGVERVSRRWKVGGGTASF
ncbi:hypothetical protein KM043_012560 [Ampulex compressa]|nr:hypothetical protein KM043_012560 [Ampulex compressa]